MKNFLWVFPLFFLVGGCASRTVKGDLSDVVGIQILDYGIYDQVRDGNPMLVRETATVRARLGTAFGFRYLVTGNEDTDMVYLKFRDSLPVLRNPQGEVYNQVEYISGVEMGVAQVCAFTFDEPWELVPGEWTFSILRGRRLLAEKTFNVVR